MTSGLKTLQVIGGSEFGGAAWIILSYIQILQEHGLEISVITSNEDVAGIYREAGCAIIPVHELRREINPVRDGLALRKLKKICREQDFDIVHTHTSKGGFIGRAAARSAKVPIVIHTAHGFAFHELSRPASIRTYSILERRAAGWCDRITTVSDFHRDWALRLGIADEEKIVTVHNGISSSRLESSQDRAMVRASLGVEASESLLAVIGRLAAQKGLEDMLDAMPAILAAQPATRLLIVGKGPISALLESRCRQLGVEKKVIFTGFRSDIGELLNACDIVVSPTLREGLSVSILEAMAMGKPIIATGISSNRELVIDGETGLLVPAADTSSIARAVITLITDREKALRFGRQARERFDQRFSEEIMQQRLWTVYEGLIRDKLANRTFS
ncbi:MAG: glycosyltransferase family 4 protein [Actinobacteria bacterium]|nr:glycosyltransferase family 4 protein [Actinomycetota bacterium]